MPVSKRNLSVACNLEDAFEYVADWNNMKNFLPMLVSLKPVSLVQYGPGTSLETTMMLGKVQISTTLDLVEFVKNKRIMYKASRGFKAKAVWDFSQLGDKLLLSFTFEYEIPPGLVNRDSEREAIEKDIDSNASQSIDLLKWMLETHCGMPKT
jgi:ribosome-associated toxin RatA of RatAB toxin-antitoxin module